MYHLPKLKDSPQKNGAKDSCFCKTRPRCIRKGHSGVGWFRWSVFVWIEHHLSCSGTDQKASWVCILCSEGVPVREEGSRRWTYSGENPWTGEPRRAEVDCCCPSPRGTSCRTKPRQTPFPRKKLKFWKDYHRHPWLNFTCKRRQILCFDWRLPIAFRTFHSTANPAVINANLSRPLNERCLQ